MESARALGLMRHPVPLAHADGEGRRTSRWDTIHGGVGFDDDAGGWGDDMDTRRLSHVLSHLLAVVLAVVLGTSCATCLGCSSGASTSSDGVAVTGATATVEEAGTYTSKDELALYIHTYGHLPSNFVSKTKARKAGWVSSRGNLDEVLPGKSIGGSVFNDDDDQLPDADGRTWTECDVDYTGGYRGAERIVFSNDGLVYYTPDHYQTFECLYTSDGAA
jgi:hypothetical protein